MSKINYSLIKDSRGSTSKSFFYSLNDKRTEFFWENSLKKEKLVSGIPEKLTTEIIKKLKMFEQRKEFLIHEITLISIAKKFNTNSSYLSKVINEFKGKNFANYINDLRIEYTINQLNLNSKYRQYSIAAVADEAGFNNSKSFSRAFLKRTGKQASVFIRELG